MIDGATMQAAIARYGRARVYEAARQAARARALFGDPALYAAAASLPAFAALVWPRLYGEFASPDLLAACEVAQQVYRGHTWPAPPGLPSVVTDLLGPTWWALRGIERTRIAAAPELAPQRAALAGLDLCGRLRGLIASCPELRYPPTAANLAFHRDTSPLRAIRAANQVGKTLSGAREMVWQALGNHPYRTVSRAMGESWITVASFEGKPYTTVSARLYEMFPHEAIDWKKSAWTRESGWRNYQVVTHDGYVLRFASSKTSSTSAASGTVDALWIDEPPRASVFGELMARRRTSQGPVWLTFTPWDSEQDLTWLREILDGPGSPWSTHVYAFDAASVYWMHPDDIATEHRLCPAEQRGARLFGDWDGEIPDAAVGCPDGAVREVALSEGWEDGAAVFVVTGADHGELAGHEVWLIAAYQRARGTIRVFGGGTRPRVQIRVLAEFHNPAASSPQDDVRGIVEAIQSAGLTPEALDWGVGDINTGGKSAAGVRLNVTYGDLLRAAGAPRRYQIAPAQKGAGSVLEGARHLRGYMDTGELSVHPRCVRLIRAMRRWRGDDDENKHYMDALRYLVAEISQRQSAQHIRG